LSSLTDKGILDPHQVKLDGRYSHLDQIKERLTFLLSFLKVRVKNKLTILYNERDYNVLKSELMMLIDEIVGKWCLIVPLLL